MLHVFKCFCILLGKNNTDTGVVNAVRIHWCKPSPRAGAAGGGVMRGVQLAGGCKHAVVACDDGNKAGGADDGAAGAADRGDIRRVQLATMGQSRGSG